MFGGCAGAHFQTSDPWIITDCTQVASKLMPAVCNRVTLFHGKNLIELTGLSPTALRIPASALKGAISRKTQWWKMLLFAGCGQELSELPLGAQGFNQNFVRNKLVSQIHCLLWRVKKRRKKVTPPPYTHTHTLTPPCNRVFSNLSL